MKRVSLAGQSAWIRSGLIGSIGILGPLFIHPNSAQAQVTTLPSSPNLVFQTSGPARCANVGDWYTTNGNARGTPGNSEQDTAATLCLPTDPAGNQTTNPAANRLHRFLISVTAADLAAAGGVVTIRVDDAGSGGPLDEVDGVQPPGVPATVDYDPTRFRLLGPAGNLIDSQTLDPLTFPGDIGRAIQFVPITQPGVYTVTSETGEFALNGYTGAFNLVRNNDDNGFRIVVNGVQDLLIGQFQGTFQNAAVAAGQNFDFFFLVGPGTSNVLIRNFDFDGDGAFSYASPTGPGPGATVSGNATWNGGGNLNTGGDLATVNGLANAGRWGINIANFGAGFTNQSALEVNAGTVPDPQQRLPVLDRAPTRAGNFTITSSSTPAPGGNGVCYAFTVTNLFFTSDIINLDLSPTDPSIIAQFRDAAGNPLTDTDGDGKVDTGILQVNESRTYSVCITSPTPPPSNLNVQGTSFMDARIRQQANTGAPTPFLFPLPNTTSTGGAANLRLVKRITNVTRGGAVLPGVNFGAIIDDPGTREDNATGWSQIPLTGVLALDTSNPVRTGDEVTYTVYFLSDGTVPALDVSICDLIPGGMTYVFNSTDVKLATANPTSGGTFFTPLAPLPANNSCPIQENPNGATIVDLGTVSNAAGNNFGFIRFRVRVN